MQKKNNVIISPSTKNIVLPIQLTIQPNNKKATLLFKKRKCKANTFGTPIKKKQNIQYLLLRMAFTLNHIVLLEHEKLKAQQRVTAEHGNCFFLSSVQFNSSFLFNSLHAAPNHNKSLLNVTISEMQAFVLKSRTSNTAV